MMEIKLKELGTLHGAFKSFELVYKFTNYMFKFLVLMISFGKASKLIFFTFWSDPYGAVT